MPEKPPIPSIKEKSSSGLNLAFKPIKPTKDSLSQVSEPIKNQATSIDSDDNKLVVGKNIILNGEIKSCEKLIVDGTVEAKLNKAQSIIISSNGYFKGNAEVNEADISGTFEGTLAAKDLLVIRKSGKIVGSLSYARIKIEDGGQVVGNMACIDTSQKNSENN